MTQKHLWVELKYTPLICEMNANGGVDVYASEAAIDIAHEEAITLCWFCDKQLTPDILDEECPAMADGDLPLTSG